MTNKKEVREKLQEQIDKYGQEYDDSGLEALEAAIKMLEDSMWISASKQLPKENEYVGDVCKYYLIQDEYGDMHVAHLSNIGWVPIDSLKAISDEVIAWMPLPQLYKAESEDK